MAGTVANPIGITNPPIDELLEKVDSKYALVIYASKRARQINSYYEALGEGHFENVGPLVEADTTDKPLSVALRELNQGDLLELGDSAEQQ
ncbi:DNA-directed RNA polymerase subunit omega [Demequina sp. SYSU T00192]|uniref:DNA-directed RNA polymerase subunit omega n=1 Tax=Demequina litoralis TaxID=3051660 RepID=A0ABT8G5R0_9MICO|nr:MULTISPECIES: DNA-directed RNA polymerase subunit omega [Demequina]MDN4474471.1 DNA-directed RNA polymerase subunit omega [Demequina sp. SYSU T00192]